MKCPTIISIFWDSIRPLKLLTVVIYPLAAVGLFWSHLGASDDASLLLDSGPWYCWAVVPLYLAVSRTVGLFYWKGTTLTRRATPVAGVIFWSMMLASNLQHPETLAFGTLFGVLAVLEGWILARAWLEK